VSSTSDNHQADKIARSFLRQQWKNPNLALAPFLTDVSPQVVGEVQKKVAEFHELRDLLGAHLQTLKVGTEIGEFTLIKEISCGTSSVVWLAEQANLHREVALKFLRPQLAVMPRTHKKFLHEAKLAASVIHPGLVKIYDVDIWHGLPFIVQEYRANGKTLLDRLESARQLEELPLEWFRQTSKLVAQIADAIQVAHDAGVMHRDIKPANILIEDEENPVVIDFGIAMYSDAHSLTGSSDYIGTPTYSSPEQTRSKSKVGFSSDIFSLGVLLYEMLTLERPFHGSCRENVFENIRYSSPREPRFCSSLLPSQLSHVCMKALEKTPDNRYLTIAEFAADLRRFLSHEPVKARPPSKWRLVKLWATRNPMLSALTTMLATVFVIVVFFAASLQKQNHELLLTQQAAEALNQATYAIFLAEGVAGQHTREGTEELASLIKRIIQESHQALIARPRRLGDIRRHFATFLANRGELSESVEQYLLAASEFERLSPPDLENIFHCLDFVIRASSFSGETDVANKALDSLRHVISTQKDSIIIWNAKVSLLQADINKETDPAGSIKQLTSLFATLEKLGPESNLLIAQCSLLRTQILMSNGDFVEVEDVVKGAIPFLVGLTGEDKSYQPNLLALLGTSYLQLGRPKEALEVLVEAAEQISLSFGSDSYFSLMIHDMLSSAYIGNGMWQEAEQLQNQLIATGIALLGKDHRQVLKLHGNKLTILRETNRCQSAKLLAAELLERIPEWDQGLKSQFEHELRLAESK